MSRSYYVIELSARWLTVLLVALALVMVLAFALGYGAAWSVLSSEENRPEVAVLTATAAPTDIPEVVIPTVVAPATEQPAPTSPPKPTETATQVPPKPTPTKVPTAVKVEFFVQVLASSSSSSVAAARTKLEGLGFSRDHQHLITLQEAGTGTLYKLRVGPFPDRISADRVAQRMSAAGFPDAWVVAE
jgi:cell division septation protein DedD